MTPYHEPRTLSPVVATTLVLLIGAMVYAATTGERGSARNELLAAAMGVSLVLFFFWFGTSRWGSEFKSITVDEGGLTVGPRTLPPEAIGRTWVIPRDRAFRARPRGRFEELRITYSSFGWLGTTDDAIVVEDLGADRPSAWLVASRDPAAVDAALATIRRPSSA